MEKNTDYRSRTHLVSFSVSEASSSAMAETCCCCCFLLSCGEAACEEAVVEALSVSTCLCWRLFFLAGPAECDL